MKKPFVLTLLIVFSLAQIVLPEKIQNIQDLQKLAEAGDSNAQCLLGLQEMIGGEFCEPQIIDRVSIEQILQDKINKWLDVLEFLPSYENEFEFKAGNKASICFKWVKKSSDQKNKYALFCIGKMYKDGIGVNKSIDEAIRNFEISARLGFAKANYGLATCYRIKNENSKVMESLWRGYNEGDLDCKTAIGSEFLYGRLLEKNEKKGFKLIEEGYHAGVKDAFPLLGICYAEGRGTSKNPSRAFVIFEEGSGRSKSAKLFLGKAYFEGIGTAQDQQKGLAIIQEIGKLNEPNAWVFLGHIYATGNGVYVDYKKALDFYSKAAELGHPQAMYELGMAYYLGSIVVRDTEKAKSWLKKSKDNGFSAAEEILKKIEKEG